MKLRERFRRFLKRWLYQELEGWLSQLQSGLREAQHDLSENVADRLVAVQGFQAQTSRELGAQVTGALAAQAQAVREQGTAISDAVELLQVSMRDLWTVSGTTFREFEAVDFAADKLELDKELSDSLDEDGRIRECANWAGKYCSENGWPQIPEFKLRELIVLKRRLNSERRVSRHG